MAEVDTELMQYGVRGMHWGVITKGKNAIKKNMDDRKAAAEKEVPVTIKAKPGKPIITKGGKNLPTSEDAKIAAIAKQKIKGTGLKALSNDEMKILVDRMNLEERYNKMSPQEISLGVKMAKEILDTPLPDLAMLGAKLKYGESKDPRAQVGIMVAETMIKSMRQNNKKKK